jgi:TetR/AcrR family transcriptional repressor of nem operon
MRDGSAIDRQHDAENEARIRTAQPQHRRRQPRKPLDDRSNRGYGPVMSSVTTHESFDVRQSILDTGQRIMAGKGFSAVGLTEVLKAAGVPKGSFYHYFNSKDAFGEALLERYFEDYLAGLDETLRQPDLTMAQRLMNYWLQWQETQSFFDCQGKCLAVKLGAEVADLSEAMRAVLKRGTSGITTRLGRAIQAGVAEGSLAIAGEPESVAESLYQLWLGASVMVKIVRTKQPFETAMITTRQILGLPP